MERVRSADTRKDRSTMSDVMILASSSLDRLSCLSLFLSAVAAARLGRGGDAMVVDETAATAIVVAFITFWRKEDLDDTPVTSDLLLVIA